MNHEFFAEYAGKWEGHEDKDLGIQVALLCEGILDNKRRAQERLKEWILDKKLDTFFGKRKETFSNLMSYRLPDLKGFPPGSFTLQFTFYLNNPYIGTDDGIYILDNPVKKEKIFKIPYIAPSQWKGVLRSVIRQMKGFKTWEDEKEDEQIIRIFGNIKGEEKNENLRQGSIHIYPTYFDQISLEVINPHERRTGTGKNPIYLESVPIDADGVFSLLYFPFWTEGEKDVYRKAAADLQIMAQGIREMMTVYGFGAKVSSGFGRAERIEGGKLSIKVATHVEEVFESFEELEKKVKEIMITMGGIHE
jgi:CRISPR-associated protein Cmr2